MDNELDARLRRLEAGQANQAAQLSRLADGQDRIHRTLAELARLMTEPDREGPKLEEVLASLIGAITANTDILRQLQIGLTRDTDEKSRQPH